MVHTSFLRSSLVRQVDVDRMDRDESTERDLWVPYPSHREPRQSWLSQYFDESCNLCFIARDISRDLFVETESSASPTSQLKHRDELYKELRSWEQRLPSIFDIALKPAPHIILLRWVDIHLTIYLSTHARSALS